MLTTFGKSSGVSRPFQRLETSTDVTVRLTHARVVQRREGQQTMNGSAWPAFRPDVTGVRLNTGHAGRCHCSLFCGLSSQYCTGLSMVAYK